MSDRKRIPIEQALNALDGKDYVHAFMSPAGGVLLGSDWERDEVEQLFKTSPPELAGPAAAAMDHGICAFSEAARDWVFFKTKPDWRMV